MRWACLFLVILLIVSRIDSEEEIDTTEETKQVEHVMHPDETDKAISDAIINYNTLMLETEEKVEKKEDSKFKNLLHGDAKQLKSLSEGDMVLDYKDREMEKNSSKSNSKRGMVAFARKMWFSRVIPYDFDHHGTMMKTEEQVKKAVDESFKTLSQLSCLTFRPRRPSDNNWLHFFKGSGCYSGIGRKYWAKTSTDVSLGDYCIIQPIILHEILHALGFYHEQTRPDRDSFVKLHFENIRPGMASNFQRHQAYNQDTQSTFYDYNGIMHYGNTAFTTNGKDTLSAKYDQNRPLGGDVLSPLDIRELNTMYQCSRKMDQIWSMWASWTSCYQDWSKGCVRARQRVCYAHPDKEKCKEGDEFGVQDDFKTCKAEECKVEKLSPQWGAWGKFSQCSRGCGDGYFTRSRECNNPPPMEGSGQYCVGLQNQTSLCKLKRCYPDNYPYDNDFESGFEPWRIDDKAPLVWKITNTETPNQESGPTEPFLTQHYAYLSAKRVADNSKAGRIISPIIEYYTSPLCVTFYYQLNGKMIYYLDFYIRTVSGVFTTFWNRRNHRGNFWRTGAFTIPAQKEKYEIVVEGKTGRAPYSDIAVDDIRVNNGRCVPGTQGCKDHYKSCRRWKRKGECHKNFKWMLKGCCSSCEKMADCENRYDKKLKVSKCEGWSKRGECVKNPTWMWKNCCSACKACVDYSHGCTYWAKQGWCEKSNWMKDHCKSSCNICIV